MHAQKSRFVDVNWTSMRQDSVRPWSGFGINLEGSWQDSVYQAEIEFPELVRIDTDDLKRWNIKPEDIPSWPVMETSVGVSHGNATFEPSDAA